MGLMQLRRGELFAGNFEIQKLLAEGGMGRVYVVVDKTCGETRALKVLLPELIANERFRKRFAQEAKIGQRIDHPAIPKIFSTGIDEATGTPYIAMELLKGQDLRDKIDRDGEMGVEEARPILIQTCAALAAAHKVGIVHRDLKPENVFLQERDGVPAVKLLDFGIIKSLDPNQTSAPGTGAIGSPMWMAPEQTSAGGRIAPATDCWALGLLAFFVMTGKIYWRAAHDDGGVGGLLRELHLDPIELASSRVAEYASHIVLPDGFDAFFLRSVARKFEDRFRDATEALPSLRNAFEPSQLIDRSANAYATVKVQAPQFASTMARFDDRTNPDAAAKPNDFGAAPTKDGIPRTLSERSAPPPPDIVATIPSGTPAAKLLGSAVVIEAEAPQNPVVPAEPVPHTDEHALPASQPAANAYAAPVVVQPPPGRERRKNYFLVWLVAACTIGFLVAVLTAVLVWVLLTVLT